MLNLVLAVPVALRVRLMRRQRLLTTILVLPVTLGTVLVAEGLLNYLGPQGWLNRALITLGLIHAPVRLIHNYWGVFLSLVITGFPFTFLLTLSYVTGIDPALEQAAADLGRRRPRPLPPRPPAAAAARPRHHLLPVLRPGLLGLPLGGAARCSRGPTRVISIAAYQAAFEQYDQSLASAIAMVMALVQLGVVVLVLSGRALVYRGPAGGGKG